MPHSQSHRQFTPSQVIQLIADNARARFRAGKVITPVVSPTGENYPVTYAYGVPNADYAAGRHTGEDHACPEGSLAIATSYGHVVHAGWGGSIWGAAYGYQVVMRTGDGKYDYAHNHLSKIDAAVEVGSRIYPGMVVGRTGATGNVSGPHDHFEARVAGGHYGSDVHPIRVKAKRRN